MNQYLSLHRLFWLGVALVAPALGLKANLLGETTLDSIPATGQLVPSTFAPRGPGGGGYTYVPSISPHDPNELFINCDMGGVYRSQDGAQSWQMQHYDQLVSQVKGKIQFSSDPNILYVCRRSTSNLNDPLWRGELAKSTDGGDSWQPLADPTQTGVHRLEVDPGSTQRMLLNEYDRLFFTSNGGNSWSQVYLPPSGNMWLGGVFWDGMNIYVGTNEGLLVSKNNGASFAIETHSGLPAGAGIYHLAGAKLGATTRLFCVPAPAADLYAWNEPLSMLGNLQGLYRMNYTASAAWTNTRANIPAQAEIAWVDLAYNNTQTVWAAAGTIDGLPMIFKSTNGGQSWTNTYLLDNNQNVSTGWAGEGGALWLNYNGAPLGFEVSPTDPNRVVMSDGNGHITTDGGQSWRATYVQPADQNAAGQSTPVQKMYRSSGLEVTTAHHIHWVNDEEMLVCNTDIGQTYSADAGESWTFARNLFQPWGVISDNNWYHIIRQPNTGYLLAATAELNDMYLGYRIGDESLDQAHGLVVRSVDQGVSWDTVYNFGHPVVWLEVDQTNPAKIYASVVHSTEGGVFQSTNGGLSWSRLPSPPRTQGHPYNLRSLADGSLVATFSARVLADGVTLTESSGVFLLPAGSNTWQDRTAAAMRFYTKDLVIDPHDPTQNTWYATVWGRFTTFAGPNNQGNGGLYRSTNRGQSWTRIWANELAESITIHPSVPGAAYVTAENDGLFFTSNLGAAPSIERVEAFPFWRPKRVFFKPGNACELWVTTMGGGIWKGVSELPGQVSYAPSTENFVNPERGFMQFSETFSSNYTPLSPSTLAAWRNLHNPGGDPVAAYSIYASLVYRGFYLESFTNGPISAAYLNAVSADFAAARQAGVKLVVRFAYTQDADAPFGDAPLNIVLGHIAQLKPLLQANADVIAVLQMGFIGAWGEGYYTDHFGWGPLSTQNWVDRSSVLNALLDALPPDRSVQVRVPQMKQKAIYGPTAPATAAPLSLAEAWQNTAKARIGFVNDCFLSDETDSGTYINYDLNASGCDTCVFKPYMAADSRYVPVGGETCADDPAYVFNNCNSQSGGSAQREMERMHFSYLNSGWFNDVNNDWVSGGCMDEIQKRLGYRIELQRGEFPVEASAGQSISIHIELKNTGFAAPFNARQVMLVLRHTTSQAIWRVALPDDPRSWLAGDQLYTLQHQFCLPTEMPVGTYELLLHLADPYPSLKHRPEYAIRLANENVWEAATGFNKLLHQITIREGASNPVCAGEDCFQSDNPTSPTATFTADTQVGCGPLEVHFSTAASPCLQYAWSFPGGVPATSTEPNPTVVYDAPGLFSVGLSVTHAAGTASTTQTDFIQVGGAPTVSFSWGASGLEAAFGNTSLQATAYTWDFGDGSALSTESDPTHQYDAPGTYTVTLIASNDCGSEGSSQMVTVSCPAISVGITASGDLSICPGEALVLQASGDFMHYQWLRDGQAVAGANAAELTVTQAGSYSLQASDVPACPATSNVLAVSQNPLPVPAFSSSVNAFNASFLNGSLYATAYSWDFGDGSAPSNLSDPSHLYAAPGTYIVELTAINSCGSERLSLPITVNCSAPEVQIFAETTTQICEGASVPLQVAAAGNFVSYTWFLNGQPIVGADGSEYPASASGIYRVFVTDATGCGNYSNEMTIEVSPLPEASIQSPSGGSVCAGLPTWLTGTGGVGYHWTRPDGSVFEGQVIDLPAAGLSDGGTYQLTVTDGSGCSDTIGYTLVVYPLPVVQIEPSGTQTILFGQTLALDAGPGFASYQWSDGATTQIIAVSSCDAYQVTVSDANTCTASSLPVVVAVQPVVTFSNGILVASPASSYQWLLDGNPIEGATAQTWVPLVSGQYSVETSCAAAGATYSAAVGVVISHTGAPQPSDARLWVYPNPAPSAAPQVTLVWQPLVQEPYTVVITDPLGRILGQQHQPNFVEKTNLDTGHITPGLYFIRVYSPRNGQMSVVWVCM